MMTDFEFEQMRRTLDADLRTLLRLIHFAPQTPISEGDIRLASVLLRKWLLDGHLSRFCFAVGQQLQFSVLDNAEVLIAIPQQPTVNYFLTGGARLAGSSVRGIYNSTLQRTDKPLLPIEAMPVKDVTLGDFLRQKRLYFEGDFFTCEEIIRFTANKHGAHHDSADSPRTEKLQEASIFMMYGGPFPDEHLQNQIQVFLVLDPNNPDILSALHLEILAAALSFLTFKLNGEQYFAFEFKPTVWARIKNLFRKPPTLLEITEYGDEPGKIYHTKRSEIDPPKSD